jgi:membrane-associated protein
MENISEIFYLLFDPEKIIHYGGLTLLLIIIFAETGILVGFIFPGDSLLFSAGLLCGTRFLEVDIFLLLISVTIAAIAGNATGYFTGKFIGKRLSAKKDTIFFKKKHLENAREYYVRYGAISVIASRFLPVIRTFVPIMAGTINMNFWKFNIFNVVGAFLWIWSLIPLGYLAGRKIPNAALNIEYFIIGITVIALSVSLIGFLKHRRANSSLKK